MLLFLPLDYGKIRGGQSAGLSWTRVVMRLVDTTSRLIMFGYGQKIPLLPYGIRGVWRRLLDWTSGLPRVSVGWNGSEMSITVEILSNTPPNPGAQVLLLGTATSPTLVDLTGVCEEGDLVSMVVHPNNTSTTARNAHLYKDSGGVSRFMACNNISNSGAGGSHFDEQWMFSFRCGPPGSTLWYGWSGSVTGGLTLFVQMNLKGLTLA